MLVTLGGQRVIILLHKILNENVSKFLVEMLKKVKKWFLIIFLSLLIQHEDSPPEKYQPSHAKALSRYQYERNHLSMNILST